MSNIGDYLAELNKLLAQAANNESVEDCLTCLTNKNIEVGQTEMPKAPTDEPLENVSLVSPVPPKIDSKNSLPGVLDRQAQFNKKTRKSRKFVLDSLLPAHLIKRIEDLQGREISYIEDELFSEEALTNPAYREELERLFEENYQDEFTENSNFAPGETNKTIVGKHSQSSIQQHARGHADSGIID